MDEFVFQKTQSWFQLPDGNWELGTILQTSANESVISLAQGKVSTNLVFPHCIFVSCNLAFFSKYFPHLGSESEFRSSDTSKS